MSEAVFIDHFRMLPRKFARKCKLLVAASPGEDVVGYWGGQDTSNQTPIILAFGTVLLPNAGLGSDWIVLRGGRNETAVCELLDGLTVEHGRPLSCIDATSYPNLEEEWDAVAPAGYTEWFSAAAPESREVVVGAIREYDEFYRANYPYSATDRDVYAVVGGWGLYIFASEWADHSESENIAFTLADAEPYYSIRRLVSGDLVSKAIIT